MPEPEDPQPIVKINMDLTKDDVVAIKISEFEDSLMAYETDIQDKLEKIHRHQTKIQNDARKLLDAEATKAFGKKLEALLVAVSAMEEVPADKLAGSIVTGEYHHYHHEEESKKLFSVSIKVINKQSSRNEEVYSSHRELPRPAAWQKLQDELVATSEEVNNLNELLAKARQTIQKMPSVERHCRAELAKQQLKKANRSDILDALNRVKIPGLPAGFGAALGLPAPKKSK